MIQKDLFVADVPALPDVLTVEAEKPNKYGFFAIKSVVDKACEIQDKKHRDSSIQHGRVLAMCEMRLAYIRVFRWIVPFESCQHVNEHYLSFDVIAAKKGWKFQNAYKTPCLSIFSLI